MARVVSQRSGPPYLLIVFVFLFVVSAAIAVLVHMDAQKTRKEADEFKILVRKLADADERNSSELAEMLKKKKARESVYAQQVRQIEDLIELVTGDRTAGVAAAKAKAKDAFDAAQSTSGLAVQVLGLKEQLEGEKGATQKMRAEVTKVAAARDARDQAIADIQTEFKKNLTEYEGRFKALDAKLQASQADYAKKLEAVQKRSADAVAIREKKVSDLTASLIQSENNVAAWKKKYEIERDKGGEAAGPEPEMAVREPDGKVTRVLDENGMCYISLGRKRRLKPGMTFSVSPADRFGDETSRKGSLLVTAVGERISLCRITASKRGNPILPGDLIENAVFDPDKTLEFAVVGDFDLSGGRSTPEGREEVEALIRRHDGKIAKEVTSRTDFLVLGDEPARPAKADDADVPAAVRMAQQDQLARWKAYQQANEEARRLRIMILNQNRFVAITGYYNAEADR